MRPLDRRIALLQAGVKQSDIARAAKVTQPTVAKVIDDKTTSDRIQRLIAKAIGKRVEEVFPARYGKSRSDRVLERLAG
ncbi:MAG: helix-turn-helix domain-containing protein [Desulfuromonadales bacterium]|nr:helix-turn-helix domain-containing protein [Desulfuromonadales bacterium]